jgi:hypothetical protein
MALSKRSLDPVRRYFGGKLGTGDQTSQLQGVANLSVNDNSSTSPFTKPLARQTADHEFYDHIDLLFLRRASYQLVG